MTIEIRVYFSEKGEYSFFGVLSLSMKEWDKAIKIANRNRWMLMESISIKILKRIM